MCLYLARAAYVCCSCRTTCRRREYSTNCTEGNTQATPYCKYVLRLQRCCLSFAHVRNAQADALLKFSFVGLKASLQPTRTARLCEVHAPGPRHRLRAPRLLICAASISVHLCVSLVEEALYLGAQILGSDTNLREHDWRVDPPFII